MLFAWIRVMFLLWYDLDRRVSCCVICWLKLRQVFITCFAHWWKIREMWWWWLWCWRKKKLSRSKIYKLWRWRGIVESKIFLSRAKSYNSLLIKSWISATSFPGSLGTGRRGPWERGWNQLRNQGRGPGPIQNTKTFLVKALIFHCC